MGGFRAGGLTGLINQPSAQVIDGSLKFDGGYLTRTPSSNGNRKTWTFSCWVKFDDNDAQSEPLLVAGDSSSDFTQVYTYKSANSDIALTAKTGSSDKVEISSNNLLRDVGWYHIVAGFDSTPTGYQTISTIYVNGVEISRNANTFAGGQNYDSWVNSNAEPHYLGRLWNGNTFKGHMSQVHLIDGLKLGPGYFGFTDPLTNTWRPKKFRAEGTTVNDGRVFSSTGTFSNWNTGSYPKTELFDGAVYTGGTPNGASTSGAATAASFDFGDQQITGFQNLQINIFISSNQASATNLASVNGIDITDEIHAAGNNTWTTVDLGSKFTTLKSFTLKNYYCYVGGFIVDGVVMKDSTTQNLDFGTNGFYLPMDGNSPIGQDKSGKGNDWTPVNFGGSNSLDKATGALPILNTVSGGKVATVGVRTDSNASSVIFAAPLISDATDVSNQINSGSTTKSGTLSGAASESVSNFYGKSLVFDGSNDSISYTNQSEFVMGTSDFTMECWVYVHSTGSERTVFGLKHTGGSGWTGYKFYLNTNAGFIFYAEDAGSGGWDVGLDAGNNTINVNTWQHLAVTRSGNTFRIFVDGVLKNSTTSSVDLNDTGDGFYIGQNGGDQQWMDGNIQDVRIYKGVAKYTSNFIPAATSPDILPDTPSGVSGSSKLTKITDGAVSFDGTGDFLNLATSTDFGLVEGDWTVECYAYITGTNGTGRLWYLEGNASNIDGVYFNNTNMSMGTTGVWSVGDGTGGDYAQNKWIHVAVCHDSTNMRMYIDGVQTLTTSNNFHNSSSKKLTLMSTNNGSYSGLGKGFISNFRIIKGTALYTSNFTPPSRTLTEVTNTKLLCCQSNTSAVDTAVSPTASDFYSAGVYLTATTYTDRGGSSCAITNNDSVTSSSAGTNSFGLTTAAAMTGQDRVDINMGNVSGSFFQSAWTLEMFFKKDASDNNWFVGTSSSGASWQTGWSLSVDGTTLKWNYDDQSGGQAKNTGITINNDTWYFMRVQRTPSTSQSRLYIEVYDSPTNRSGVFDGTVQDDQSHSNNTLKIGDANGNSNNLSANWQFANVMITAGTRKNQAVPTLSSGQRVLNATVGSISVYGDAAATTFNPFNTDINTVRGQETGYCTLNPLDTIVSLIDGNLETSNSSGWQSTRATTGMTSGKFYWETQNNQDAAAILGISNDQVPIVDGEIFGSNANPAWTWAGANYYFNSSTAGTGLSNHGTSDIVQYAFDADNGNLWFGRNGIWYNSSWATTGDPANGLNPTVSGLDTNKTYFACASFFNGSAKFNFGQKPFRFSPPDGYQPLNGTNLRPETVIARPDKFVGTTIWSGSRSGNGGLTRQINTEHQPDFVWITQRNQAYSTGHQLYDSVRGAGAEKELNSSGTAQEGAGNIESYGWLNSFDKTGFTVKGGSTDYDYVDKSGVNYVAWTWKAGGNKGVFNVDGVGYASAAAAGLSGGDRALTGCSVNTKTGFSIIGWNNSNGTNPSGAKVRHGLNQVPDLVIYKDRDSGSSQWAVKMETFSNPVRDELYLETIQAKTTAGVDLYYRDSDYIGHRETSIGSNGGKMIAYCWHNVPGLQKFGTVYGNGATNGPFIELGFRPSLVWIKPLYSYDGGNTQVAETGWYVYDNKRGPINPNGNVLGLNNNYVEQNDASDVDFLSNGFKIRNNRSINTTSNAIYCAWAEAPSFNLYGGQSNAR